MVDVNVVFSSRSSHFRCQWSARARERDGLPVVPEIFEWVQWWYEGVCRRWWRHDGWHDSCSWRWRHDGRKLRCCGSQDRVVGQLPLPAQLMYRGLHNVVGRDVVVPGHRQTRRLHRYSGHGLRMLYPKPEPDRVIRLYDQVGWRQGLTRLLD